ncbi:aminoacyl-tRNA hydrolase [Helicobacter monodelphidis]|uniref:aminoacyl-tRNA hydrolase n=1 Tax=Helicobacter sp. 15-1451 TaxID=2004995 RepID=UPI000DCE90F4|nr:aminoacyl-tRNA hydrolase [Helicobacter sp. 15-1451]RAX57600.1 aminoacyl-tRNA hydrolase [Helicobacter sp. 15-1451]
MNLFVGLGNPTERYRLTRHNAGFLCIDAILHALLQEGREANPIHKAAFQGELYKYSTNLFLKPTTYMNLSGHSVNAVWNFYRCECLIVIYDDLDLPLGSLRFKQGGGHGGHNGLRSIDSFLPPYLKLRIGIGSQGIRGADYVLSSFRQEELEILQSVFKQATEAVLQLIQGENWEKIASLYTLKAS